MQLTLARILSAGIAISYAILAVHCGGVGCWKWWLVLLLPLAMILLPEEIGNLTGYYKIEYVNVQTPGTIGSFLGLFLLVGLPVLLYLVRKLVG